MDTSSIRNRQLLLFDVLRLPFAISGKSHEVNRATGESCTIDGPGTAGAVKEAAAPTPTSASFGLVTSLVTPSHLTHFHDPRLSP